MTDHDLPTDEPSFEDHSVDEEASPEIDELPSAETVPEDLGTVQFDTEATDGVTTEEEPEAAGVETKTVYRGSGIRWGFVAGLVLAVLLVILVFQNTGPVEFSFLVWEIRTPLAALLIATAVIAAVADELVGLVVRSRRRRRLAEREELLELRQRQQSGM